MATYLFFGNYSIGALEEMGAGRTQNAHKLAQKFDGEIKSSYALLGNTDLVIIAAFPGTEQAMKFSVAMAKSTGIAFSTSEAVDMDTFDRLISEI